VQHTLRINDCIVSRRVERGANAPAGFRDSYMNTIEHNSACLETFLSTKAIVVGFVNYTGGINYVTNVQAR